MQIQNKLTPTTKRRLSRDISLDELTEALSALANSKSSGLDGIVAEVFKALWPTIGQDYLYMIQKAIIEGSLPKSVTTGMIVLLES